MQTRSTTSQDKSESLIADITDDLACLILIDAHGSKAPTKRLRESVLLQEVQLDRPRFRGGSSKDLVPIYVVR